MLTVSRPTSLPEENVSIRKKSKEPTSVLTFRVECSVDRWGGETKRSNCEGWKLNGRNPTDRVEGQELLPEEIEDAEEEIISRAQLEAFSEKYKALLTERETPKKTLLRKLCPRLDDQDVMRCQGRLQSAECLPYDARVPVTSPRDHLVTRLIVKHYHELSNHNAGKNFVLSQISERFWIVAAREKIRS